jgi:hypothetical protein
LVFKTDYTPMPFDTDVPLLKGNSHCDMFAKFVMEQESSEKGKDILTQIGQRTMISKNHQMAVYSTPTCRTETSLDLLVGPTEP